MNNTTTGHTGGPPPLQYDQLTLFSILVGPWLIEGLLGNLLLLLLLAKERSFHTPPYLLMASLACSDILFISASQMLGLINRWIYLETSSPPPLSYPSYDPFCKFLAFVTDVAVLSLALNMIGIAFNRYIMIVRFKYASKFTITNTLILIVIIWLISCLWIFPALVGWGDLAYDPMLFLCKYVDSVSQSFTVFLNVRTPMALIVLCTCYAAIFIKVRTSSRNVHVAPTHASTTTGKPMVATTGGLTTVEQLDPDTADKHEQVAAVARTGKNQQAASLPARKRELNLLLQFSLIFLAYFLSWGFYVLFVVLASVFGVLIPHAGFIIHYVLTMNSALNPPIYFIFNKEMRAAAKRLFCCK